MHADMPQFYSSLIQKMLAMRFPVLDLSESKE